MGAIRIGISGWTYPPWRGRFYPKGWPGARLVGTRQSSAKRDVFVYFDNDVKVHAPFDAMSLAHRLKLGVAPTGAPDFSKINEGARREWPQIPRRWRARAS